jgi:hypothetical protein
MRCLIRELLLILLSLMLAALLILIVVLFLSEAKLARHLIITELLVYHSFSLSDLLLSRRLFSSSPFALRFASSPILRRCLFKFLPFAHVFLRRRLFSSNINHHYQILHACKR